MMSDAITQALRVRAAELLDKGEVVQVIGWSQGRFANQTTPFFASSAADAQRLLFNQYCANTLSKYLLYEKKAGKSAVCVRGCDSRGVNRLLSDNQLKPEDVYLLGIPCDGMTDAAGQPLQKCLECSTRQPLAYDELLTEAGGPAAAGGPTAAGGPAVAGEPARADSAAATGSAAVTDAAASDGADRTHSTGIATDAATAALSPAAQTAAERRFDAVAAVEQKDVAERRQLFDAAYQRCIRCYACREVCPCCSCRECFVDQVKAGWQGKQSDLAQNRFYNLTRVFHIGDRCVECGECERVCPMGLPLMLLNRKMVKDLRELFDAPDAGMGVDGLATLADYALSDREEFM
jgi:ferredoxin